MTTIADEMKRLRDDLAWRPGSLLLIVGDGSDRLASNIAARLASPVTSVGSLAAEAVARGEDLDPVALIADGSVITDLDVLFWAPALHVDVLSVLSRTARRRRLAAVWPGSISNDVARYSEPGRRDFYEKRLDDAIILRPKADSYPDETPYTIERVGAA